MKINPKLLLDTLFPIGAIYINTTNTNPSTFLGGTWEAFGKGKVMVGYNSSETEFNSLLKTGGEKKHTLTIDEMPSHNHTTDMRINWYNTDSSTGALQFAWSNNSSLNIDRATIYAQNKGGSQAHNNLQPYIVVSMWKRTA